MDSRMKNILTGILSLWLVGCASMSAYKEPLKVSLLSIQPGDMTLLEQRFAIQLRILNPNDIEIPVKGLSYSLEINEREFAYGVSQQAVTIPAFGEALLDVEVVSNLLNVMQQLQSLDGEQHDSLGYRLSGTLSLENRLGRLPFSYGGELEYRPRAGAAPHGG